MTLAQIVMLGVFPFAMAYAAASDLISMTISNRLCLFLVASFAVCTVLLGLSPAAIGWHLAAGALVLVVAFGLFAAGWIGGGDAKLAAATALWLGFGLLPTYGVFASIFGGALTLAILQLRRMALEGPLSTAPWLARLREKNGGIPYGIALAIGALLIYPETIWMKAVDLARFHIG